LDLADTDRRLQAGQAEIEAELLVIKTTAALEAEISQRPRALGESLIVADEHPALARGHELVGIKAEAAHAAEIAAASPTRAGAVAAAQMLRAVRLGGVLDDRQMVFVR